MNGKAPGGRKVRQQAVLVAAYAVARRSCEAAISDPLLRTGARLLLAGLALLACYVRTRKVTEIDPLAALRQG